MKFMVIQSNNRGIISKIGDLTFCKKKPKSGEEKKIFPTLFIWVKKPKRILIRAWIIWTGKIKNGDYIYRVKKFRDAIDISGHNEYHQWSNNFLRQKLWDLDSERCDLSIYKKIKPLNQFEERDNKTKYLKIRKERIKSQTPLLNESEKIEIKKIYKKRTFLNNKNGSIKFHIDHIYPISKGGLHHPHNLRLISAKENLKKGSKTEI